MRVASSPRSLPTSASTPRPISPTVRASTVTAARETLWMSAITRWIVPGGNCAPKSLISRPVFGRRRPFIIMALRIRTLVTLTLLAGHFVHAQAQTPAPAGDAKRGHALAYTCNGCHAIPNYKNVYPTYSVPKLRGQKPEYLVAALKAYKSGERSHGTMHSQAATMTETDMRDVAAFLAGPAAPATSNMDVPATD